MELGYGIPFLAFKYVMLEILSISVKEVWEK